MADEEMVSITKKRYNYLVKRDRKLSALEFGGVDNWEWYGESISDYEENHGPIDPEDEE